MCVATTRESSRGSIRNLVHKWTQIDTDVFGSYRCLSVVIYGRSNLTVKTDLDILIMAAGLGTRMKSNLAKVLHRLDGRPLINHVCETSLALRPNSINVIVGHQADDVKLAVTSEFSDDKFAFPVQKQQLGTGDAVNSAKKLLKDRDSVTLVLSGDVPLISSATLKALLSKQRRSKAACTILTVELENPTGYGRVIREGEDFSRIVEQKDASDEEKQCREINSGIYCFDTKKLFQALAKVGNTNAQGEYYLTDVPTILKNKGDKIALFLHTDEREIEGINDRRQLASMEAELRSRTITKLMLESGVSFVDPSSAYISAKAKIGRDTVISQNVTVEGNTVIGENCVVRPGVRIANSMIGNNVEVKDNSFITDSSVGNNCDVGPMAHLRGKALMADGAKVGNFVELKKTLLGRGSKASHLTYLGDATIGEKTNIGAGTITCNYDGVNKHATIIGNNVKIGSDTMLVAPITVGDGAVTGAGSVVTKDIAPNKLAVGAPARSIRDLKKT